MGRLMALGTIAAVFLMSAAIPLSAQKSATDTATVVATAGSAGVARAAAVAGPTRTSVVGVSVESLAKAKAEAKQSSAVNESVTAIRGRTDPNVILMIVGGALLLAGLAIDDDAGTILALTGLGLGVYGLIKHLD